VVVLFPARGNGNIEEFESLHDFLFFDEPVAQTIRRERLECLEEMEPHFFFGVGRECPERKIFVGRSPETNEIDISVNIVFDVKKEIKEGGRRKRELGGEIGRKEDRRAGRTVLIDPMHLIKDGLIERGEGGETREVERRECILFPIHDFLGMKDVSMVVIEEP
jgi:hypothetical protein